MPATKWQVQTADFRRTEYRETMHDGCAWLMAECEELIDGRREGFISMVPDTRDARWAVRLPVESKP